MTNEELRAQIYHWLYECYKINATTSKEKENRKKLKAILDGFNPTQKMEKVVKKEYLNTRGQTKVWRMDG